MTTDYENEIRRAEQAQMILTHPLFTEAFEKLDRELRDAWLKSPSRDVDGRESLWLSVKLLSQVRTHLESLVNTGKMADITLSRLGQR